MEANRQEVTFRPDDAKAKVWREMITNALHADRLSYHEADVLCGRLAWAVCTVGGPAARARVKALYKHVHGAEPGLSDVLRPDLKWWLGVLGAEQLSRTIPLNRWKGDIYIYTRVA